MKKGLVILMAASGIIAAAPKNEPVERIRGALAWFRVMIENRGVIFRNCSEIFHQVARLGGG